MFIDEFMLFIISFRMLKYFAPRVFRVAARTASEAMSVAERIDSKRAQAMVGGGERRIQAQHKKVKFFSF